MASAYFRAMATCSMLKRQLEKETFSRQAMELCFKKIHKSLDLYKGHFINRIRFHMNRHHTEYLRKVRLHEMEKKAAKKKAAKPKEQTRRSERVSQLEEVAAELAEAKKELALKTQQIDELCALLEAAERHPDCRVDTEVPRAKHDQGSQADLCEVDSQEDLWDGVLIGP